MKRLAATDWFHSIPPRAVGRGLCGEAGMKLTLKENPDAIGRYAHIKPAPLLGAQACSAACPGTNHTCTLAKGHTGVHVAHGRFRKVVAVWDRHAQVQEPKRLTKAGQEAAAIRKAKKESLPNRIKGIWGRLVPSSHVIEATVLVVFFLGMVWWAIDLAIKIFGAF